ncbi:ATP-binding protein, partial [Mesorhizobium sp. M1374]|uniref:ATP-binding protein n=1 Tax=Mesorhizobium sp. M1374 TaxID=2957091 RepID=UPI00333CF8E1
LGRSAFPATRSINFNADCNGPGDQGKVHHEAFADPTVADAILDRIVHNAHRIVLQGDSMRKQKAAPLLTGAENGEINHP